MKRKPVCIACSVFRSELQSLFDRGQLNLDLKFIDLTLHMNPVQMQDSLDIYLKKEIARGNYIILIYGHCSPGMNKVTANSCIARVEGKNCFEIILGEKEYLAQLKSRSFFLLPKWIEDWRKYFIDGFGMDSDIASSMMEDTYKKILYLDTGVTGIEKEKLRKFSDYCRLPVEIKKVSLKPLMDSIKKAVEMLNRQAI